MLAMRVMESWVEVAPFPLAAAFTFTFNCRFRDGLVFKAHRLLYHSTLGLRVIKKKKKKDGGCTLSARRGLHLHLQLLKPSI